jgi:putative redox protein
MSVAACMGIDIKVILEKGRVTLNELVIEVSGERAPDPPRRFRTLRMTVRAEGPAEADRPKLDRAVELSRDKYCSVFHTLRPDLDVQISTEIV